MDKLYIVVREDLPPGLVASQAVHAARDFAAKYPELEAAWYATSNTIAILGVPDAGSLEALACAADGKHPLVRCTEPDLGDELTALALGPSAKRVVSALRLAFKPPRAA